MQGQHLGWFGQFDSVDARIIGRHRLKMHQVPGAQVEHLGGDGRLSEQFRSPVQILSGKDPSMGMTDVPAVKGPHLSIRR